MAGGSLFFRVLTVLRAIVSGSWSVLGFADTEENHIWGRQDEQGQESRYEQATHDSEGHRPPDRCNRNKAQHRRNCGQHYRPETRDRALYDRIPQLTALRALGLDLLDENDRIARDHAHQSQNSENCDETERAA